VAGNNRIVLVGAASFAAGAALAIAAAGLFSGSGLVGYRAPPPRMSEAERKFAELTWQLSRDQSALDKECRDRRAQLDSDRLTALRALTGAAPILGRFEQETSNARNAKETALARAEAERAQKERDLTFGRSEKLLQIKREQQEADRQTLSERDEAFKAAKQRRDTKIVEIHKLPLSQQSGLLREAEAVYTKAVDDARAACDRKVQQNRDVMQSKERQAVADEESGSRRATDQANRLEQAAEDVYQADLKAAHAREMQALTGVAGAAEINADLDNRRAALDRECRDRTDALLANFRKAKEALGIPDQPAPGPPATR
jgi:hypothetical protein